MSGFEAIGLVLALFPIVETAIKIYAETKPGHTAASLLRKLKTETIIYDQLVRNLLDSVVPASTVEKLLDRSLVDLPDLWKDGDLQQALLGRLGTIKSRHLLEMLVDMNQRLKTIEVELTNISRGTEVLEKFRTRFRAARANAPKSRVHTNLVAVSEINRDLRRLLQSDAISFNHIVTKSQSEYVKFLHRDSIDLRELYDTVSHSYDCRCDEPHLATLGCRCPSCQTPFSSPKTKLSSWTPELLLWPRQQAECEPDLVMPDADSTETSETNGTAAKEHRASSPSRELQTPKTPHATKRRSCSISVLPSRERTSSSQQENVIQDLCAVIDNFATRQEAETILGILEMENKKYSLNVDKAKSVESESTILRPVDLIKSGGPALSTRKRLQIAFQICHAVLQLCTTPWIDDSWSWGQRCVIRKMEAQTGKGSGPREDDDFEIGDESYHLFVTQQFYSSKHAQAQAETLKQSTLLGLVATEPFGQVLVKLGCALIELGFGKTLKDIRDDKPPLWLGGLEKTLDSASLDFVTASKLLESGEVKAEVGLDYANVVKVCISRHYHDVQESGIKEFSGRGDQFFECAEEAIMHPLFDWIRIFG